MPMLANAHRVGQLLVEEVDASPGTFHDSLCDRASGEELMYEMLLRTEGGR